MQLQMRAAAVAGRLAAQGLLSAQESMPAVLRAARLAAPGHDPAGRRMVLLHAFVDSRDGWERQRARTAMRVRAAAAAALAAGLGSAEVWRNLQSTAEGGGLLAHEVAAQARLMLVRHLRRGGLA